ncbi:MAG: hypothetical protein SGJ19_06450 [Planctomycetia bacterium]|nr:hypothetical protein [Planctomycetia bacterium]
MDNGQPSRSVENLEERMVQAAAVTTHAHRQSVQDMLGSDRGLQLIQEILVVALGFLVRRKPRIEEFGIMLSVLHNGSNEFVARAKSRHSTPAIYASGRPGAES